MSKSNVYKMSEKSHGIIEQLMGPKEGWNYTNAAVEILNVIDNDYTSPDPSFTLDRLDGNRIQVEYPHGSVRERTVVEVDFGKDEICVIEKKRKD